MPVSSLSTEVCAGAGSGRLQRTPYTGHSTAITACLSRRLGIPADLYSAASFRRTSVRQQAAKSSSQRRFCNAGTDCNACTFSQETRQQPFAVPGPQLLKQQNTTEDVRLLRLPRVRNATLGPKHETCGKLTHERSAWAARRRFIEGHTFALHSSAHVDTRRYIPGGAQRMH
ncbi:unnamed protein product, partial [Rangifer tarandus platyrhynchus]